MANSRQGKLLFKPQHPVPCLIVFDIERSDLMESGEA